MSDAAKNKSLFASFSSEKEESLPLRAARDEGKAVLFLKKKNQKDFYFPAALTWVGIFRLGLVQGSLGAVVVLATSTLNRVMVVELALPALLPGGLVALHYVLQVLRPRLGFGSDVGGRRTPFILGGMALLALSGFAAAVAVTIMPAHFAAGLALALAAYCAIGVGVGAAGTNVLVLMAKQVAPHRRGAAATIVWVMMIFGIVAASAFASVALHPFSFAALRRVAAIVAGGAFATACIAIWRLERTVAEVPAPAAKPRFAQALREVWAERRARAFAIFVFLSMAAHGAQELLIEPFAGAVFGFPPAATAALTSLQHGGVMLGMIAVGLLSLRRPGALRGFALGGCAASALALAALSASGLLHQAAMLKPTLFCLGFANGMFAVSAIGAMMTLAAEGVAKREGLRMGVWGAAQALAFGAGSLLAPALSNALGLTAAAYAAVFGSQALLFIVAAVIYPDAAPTATGKEGSVHFLNKTAAHALREPKDFYAPVETSSP